MQAIPAVLLVSGLLLAGTTLAQDPVPQRSPARSVDTESMASWLKGLYTAEEFRALSPNDISMTPQQCGCYDKPVKHYPYAVVVLATPKGELILRPEQREMQVSFVKLATRHGKLYCDPDATGECFGEFADLCEFTDFRYGPLLAPYFPTCKTED